MNLKIIHRTSSIWNIIGFVLLSFFFLFVETAILNNRSGLDINFLKEFIKIERTLLLGTLITIASIYFHMRLSKLFLALNLLTIVGIVSVDIYQSFDKFILTMLFFFILASYYFYMLLQFELNRACLKPNYSLKELFDPMLYKIPCSLSSNGVSEGYLLNWDDSSCFISCEWKEMPKNKKVTFTVEYNGYKFLQLAKIVSFKKSVGIGLVFIEQHEESRLNWVEFNKIINDLGYTVGYLK